jgi:hypothetical protein
MKIVRFVAENKDVNEYALKYEIKNILGNLLGFANSF